MNDVLFPCLGMARVDVCMGRESAHTRYYLANILPYICIKVNDLCNRFYIKNLILSRLIVEVTKIGRFLLCKKWPISLIF
jgi:hypothetical protein